MSSITIDDIDADLEQRLKARAAVHGRSVEAEARDILADALKVEPHQAPPDNLASAIRAIVEPIGGVDLEPVPRQIMRDPPSFA